MRDYIKSDRFDAEYEALCRRLPAEEFCNLAITLIKQTQYLLDRMLQSQQRRFLEQGGIREAMSNARRAYRNNQSNRNNQNNSNSSNPSNPSNSSNSSNPSNPSNPAS
ncbi:MAG: four helix bundle suffix domain-containing protein [Muribaculaceae bacterium]|nr:four helix bundle suffix domain-containing protein [Muribaculaceae bacterium]